MPSNRPSLKALVAKGSTVMVASYGAVQAIRLAKNLILTRLLFPEAFGTMTLVWSLMYGLVMLSDVGMAPAIVRDKRGDDPDFLNTAWTIQAYRGALLWLAACLLARPMADFYGAPELAQLVPVAGITALLSGFNSTAVHTCRRRMQFGRPAVLDLANEVVGFVAVVLWALIDRSVWALVGGALIGQLFFTLGTHTFLPGIRNHFRWDPTSVRVLRDFGKWIYFASVFTFLSTQADRILLGHYLDMTKLGVYAIAIMLSEAVSALTIKIIRGVLFPAYGEIFRTESKRLQQVVRRARLALDILLILPIGILMITGSWVVAVLYDARYQEAGWMFQLLCLRLLMAPALLNSEACLMTLGHPQYSLIQNVSRGIWIVVSIPVGWYMAGIKGVVWAVALSEVLPVAVLWFGMARHRMLAPFPEARSLVFAGIGALFGFGLLHILPSWHR